LRTVNGEVESLAYRWRPVGAVRHAFSRSRNRPRAQWLISMCGERVALNDVRKSEADNARSRRRTTSTCFACRVLMNDQLS